ncbi:MAG: aspartate-semialdehyde dehydrogenase [Clostridia bacterium]|nr:aspartate-semialdehyde dehydrogenase [Clostridia bacterium]
MKRIAIVGCTGLVGETLMQLLDTRSQEYDLYLFASHNSIGGKYRLWTREYSVQELNEDNLLSISYDYAFFVATNPISAQYIPLLTQRNTVCIDNSSTYRLTDAPLIIPEINGHLARQNNGIISNPNCTTAQIALALYPLHRQYGIKRVVVSTYQAVSGGGKDAIADLVNNRQYGSLTHFEHPITSNCIPRIDLFCSNGYTGEEMKVILECAKILQLNPRMITCTAVRVPVVNCHCVSINCQFNSPIDIDDVKHLLHNQAGVALLDNPSQDIYPMPILVNGLDEVYVGRVRRDDTAVNSLNMFVVADNLRKGAALNAYQILQLLEQ